MPHGGVDALHVAPAIWAPIFQKENLGSDICRHVLGVFNNACLTACAVAAWYKNNFLRGVAVADGATVQSALYARIRRPAQASSTRGPLLLLHGALEDQHTDAPAPITRNRAELRVPVMGSLNRSLQPPGHRLSRVEINRFQKIKRLGIRRDLMPGIRVE